jgi:hypothetical protein
MAHEIERMVSRGWNKDAINNGVDMMISMMKLFNKYRLHLTKTQILSVFSDTFDCLERIDEPGGTIRKKWVVRGWNKIDTHIGGSLLAEMASLVIAEQVEGFLTDEQIITVFSESMEQVYQ